MGIDDDYYGPYDPDDDEDDSEFCPCCGAGFDSYHDDDCPYADEDDDYEEL